MLVKVQVVGVNPVEIYIRKGAMGPVPLPHILGYDCAGVVHSVGDGVTKFKVIIQPFFYSCRIL